MRKPVPRGSRRHSIIAPRRIFALIGLLLFFEGLSFALWRSLAATPSVKAFEEMYLIEPSGYNIFPHPFLQFIWRGYSNERNRFINALLDKDPTTLYIAVLGGSTSADGWEPWPRRLEKDLNDRLAMQNSSLKVVVFNFATPAWGSLQSIQNYFLLLRYLPPDIVIVHHNTNDRLFYSRLIHGTVIRYPEIGVVRRFIVRHSHLIRLLTLIAHRVRYAMLTWQAPALDQFYAGGGLSSFDAISIYVGEPRNNVLNGEGNSFRKDYSGAQYAQPLDGGAAVPYSVDTSERTIHLIEDAYQSLIRSVQAHNGTVILTTQYLNYSRQVIGDMGLTSVEPYSRHARLVNEMIRSLAVGGGVSFVDLDRIMEPYDSLMLQDGIHWTPEGVSVKELAIREVVWQDLVVRGMAEES